MNEMEAYIEALFPPDEDLARVLESIRAKGMPEISVPTGYGRLLTLLVQMSGAKELLEIGALGGYSGICLARGLGGGGSLTSLELLQEYADTAKENLEAAGLGSRVSHLVGDAGESLERLTSEGRRYDFFFIDADKGGYVRYLDAAIGLANPGAVIVADNTLLRGRVADLQRSGPSVLAMREFNERVASDRRLTGTLLPAYDGLAVVRVNP
ncbi:MULTISPECIES: O-methyltransferase [Paenibacillus]|uniref:O-methyltransferase n=1 Tax=Paenibacillus TaxID=44249 RepID=UPI000431F229|nr:MULTISPECIES: O-methyltransferase [Paenibacillus]CDN44699.1 Probable caffeoyl-CoA O-methyltransferase 2 [Paenibacillus sp. P22]